MYNSNFHAYNDKYTYEDVIERQLKAGVITNDDKDLIIKYIRDKLKKGQIQDRRAQRVSTMLTQWRRFINVPYRELTLDAILDGKMAMEKGKSAYGYSYKDNTLNSNVKTIKTFAAWLCRKKIISLDLMELDEIKPKKETYDSVLPKDVLSDPQINAIIDACQHMRDKALIAIIAETGCRIQEAASLTWADLEFKENNVSIHIIDAKDKSKSRNGYVSLRKSYIVELRKAQSGDKDTDFIFRIIDRGHKDVKDEPITYKAVCHVVEKAAKKAGVPLPKGGLTKIFRVSSVTNKLKTGVSTTAIMKTTWSGGLNSKMFKHYEKLCDLDTERMIMQGVGIEEMPRPERTPDATAIKCICGELCAPKAKFCPECGTALTREAENEVKGAKEDAKELLKKLLLLKLEPKEYEELLKNL